MNFFQVTFQALYLFLELELHDQFVPSTPHTFLPSTTMSSEVDETDDSLQQNIVDFLDSQAKYMVHDLAIVRVLILVAQRRWTP